MPDAPTPWFGLAALILMFAIPFLPRWLFEGPRKVRHWPQRHACAECGAPWTDGHLCAEEALVEVKPEVEPPPPLRSELRRVRPRRQLEPRREAEAWVSR